CFGSREELLAEVFRQRAGTELAAVRAAVDRAEEQGEAAVVAELSALIDTVARRAFAGRTLAWALLTEPAGELSDAQRRRFRRQYANLTEEIIARAIAAGTVPDQDVRVVGPGIIGLISEALTGPLSPEGAVPTDRLITTVTHMCLRAIGGPQ